MISPPPCSFLRASCEPLALPPISLPYLLALTFRFGANPKRDVAFPSWYEGMKYDNTSMRRTFLHEPRKPHGLPGTSRTS